MHQSTSDLVFKYEQDDLLGFAELNFDTDRHIALIIESIREVEASWDTFDTIKELDESIILHRRLSEYLMKLQLRQAA